MPQFEALNVQVFGVSPDSCESHRLFISDFDLKVRILSDENHSFMEAVGSWGEKVLYGKTSIGVKRSTVIVAPDGTVAHRWAAARAKGHAAKVLEVLQKLMKTRA